MPAPGSWSEGTCWSQGLGWRYVAVFWGDSPPSCPPLSREITRPESAPLPFGAAPHSTARGGTGPSPSPSGILGTVLPGPHAQPRAAPLHGDRGGGSATLACAPWGPPEPS